MLVEELVWIESDKILTGANKMMMFGEGACPWNDKYEWIQCSDLQEATGGAVK